ncbi:MAG: pirin family protein [Jiangellaceae bacterium]|nr:pirin family protein [Jiangellaceae bacterium]
MSNLELAPSEDVCGGRLAVAERPVEEFLYGREVVLGTRGMVVTRTLPNRDRRMVGAWCFIDHYGPEDTAMRVPPHPHTGLQTVSWLVDGEILHRDSLGSLQPVRPGQLNLMTAGRAIAHSEESPAGRAPTLHGVQLWVALPEPDRDVAAHFEHHPDLPVVSHTGVSVTVIMGSLDGVGSPAQSYSPLIGAQVALDAGAVTDLPLRPDFEHAALVLFGQVDVAGSRLDPGPLLYLGSGRSDLRLAAGPPSRLLLVGGAPFDEQIVMWWNFVGRSHEEIVRFREEWMSGRRFGEVKGYAGDPLPAPPMPTTPLKPRGRVPRTETGVD